MTIQDIVIRGTRAANADPVAPDNRRRPGITAGSLRRLTLRNVDIEGTYGSYMVRMDVICVYVCCLLYTSRRG